MEYIEWYQTHRDQEYLLIVNNTPYCIPHKVIFLLRKTTFLSVIKNKTNISNESIINLINSIYCDYPISYKKYTSKYMSLDIEYFEGYLLLNKMKNDFRNEISVYLKYDKMRRMFYIQEDNAQIVKTLLDRGIDLDEILGEKTEVVISDYKKMYPFIFGVGSLSDQKRIQLKYITCQIKNDDSSITEYIRISDILSKILRVYLTKEQKLKVGIPISRKIITHRPIEKIQIHGLEYKINKYDKFDYNDIVEELITYINAHKIDYKNKNDYLILPS